MMDWSMAEVIARAISDELGMQDIGFPYLIDDDLTRDCIGQNPVDYAKVAIAVMEAINHLDAPRIE